MKKTDEYGNYTYLTVGEIRKANEGKADDIEVFMRTVHNPTGNICEAGVIEEPQTFKTSTTP